MISSQRILSCQHSGRKHDAHEDDVSKMAMVAKFMAENSESFLEFEEKNVLKSINKLP
jgi:hypothetical protein